MLKIYDATPLKTRLADKYLARDWIAQQIGEEHLIPLLGMWKTADDIDTASLPNEFVLKANHGSGMNVIVRDKNTADWSAIKEKFRKWLATDYSFPYFEMQYHNIPRCIIAEKYMATESGDLPDYKFFCADGEFICMYCGETYSKGIEDEKCEFFDKEFNLLPFHRTDWKRLETLPSKPANYDEMVSIAEKLSKGFSFVRVDLYDIAGRIYFGEMTFTPTGGYLPLDPPSADTWIGEKIKLPSTR